MPKNILQDVMPPTKKTIRDIPLPNNRKKAENKKENEKEHGLSDFPGPIEDIRPPKKGASKTKWWFLVVAVFVAVYFFLAFVFSGAEIILVPKQEKVDLELNLTAVRDDIKSNEEGIPFKTILIEGEDSRSTSNVTEKEVDKKASGEIIVFNDYSSSPERLVINTRFETLDGLIYRIPKSTVIPGRTTVNGKTTPGSITVTVYADSPGEDYNIGLVDFTIPGFKGTDRFSKYYARSKTEMTGGYSGIMKVVEDNELEKMRNDINVDLEKELKSKVYSQVPEGYVLYEDGIFVDFQHQPNLDLGDSVQVVEKGILRAVLFDKSNLSNFIAENLIAGLGEGIVEISNLEDLIFKIDNKENIKPWEDNQFTFSLSGSAQFVWTFDEEKMKADFAGQSKKNTDSILSNFIGITDAEVIISPFWKSTFPENTERIKIEIKESLN
ncbi:hypothetical protein KKG48_02425 [Patescibacteria group bacterium]|nr:hypothetical protein [Patescibacteria group bacterium]